jgi:hypothetical protein
MVGHSEVSFGGTTWTKKSLIEVPAHSLPSNNRIEIGLSGFHVGKLRLPMIDPTRS